MTKHIILIGFKYVGKSAIGRELAKQIGRKFVDLDEEVQKLYHHRYDEKLTCRQIMLKHGQETFRQIEHEAFKIVLDANESSVLSLGGGTPMYKKNHELIKGHIVLQITAPKNIVYERIMISGRPAFFPPDKHPLESFNLIWDERQPVYNQLSEVKINNSKSLQSAVDSIKSLIADKSI